MATVKVESYNFQLNIGEYLKEDFFSDFEETLGRRLTNEEKGCFIIDPEPDTWDTVTRLKISESGESSEGLAWVDMDIQYQGNSEEIIQNFHKWMEYNGHTKEEIEGSINIKE